MAVSREASRAGERGSLRNLIAAIATIVVADIGFGLTYPLLNVILDARHVDAAVIGLNAAMGPLGIIAAGPFIPRLARNVGGRRLALAAMIAIILVLLSFPLFPAVEIWFVTRFLFGVAGGTLYTLSEAWILGFAPADARGRVAAIYGSMLSLGFSAGPFLLPYTGVEGYLPFVLAAILVGLSALPLFFIDLADTEGREALGTTMLGFARRAPLLLFAVATLTMFDAVMLAFFPIFGLRSGLDLKTASWALAVAIAGNAVLQYPVGWLADRWSRQGVLWAAVSLTPLLALSLPFVVLTSLLWPVALLLGTSAYAVYIIAMTVMGDRFQGSDLVAGSAAFAAMWGVGGIIGPPLAGFALDLLGPSGIAFTMTAIYAGLIAGLWLSGGELVRERMANSE
jgi:MFS family permease